MMNPNLTSMMRDVRALTEKIKLIETTGMLVREQEIGEKSFVQLTEAIPLIKGMVEPVTWQYHQIWMDKSPTDLQNALMGAYLNEQVGPYKIIGIFSVAKPNSY